MKLAASAALVLANLAIGTIGRPNIDSTGVDRNLIDNGMHGDSGPDDVAVAGDRVVQGVGTGRGP